MFRWALSSRSSSCRSCGLTWVLLSVVLGSPGMQSSAAAAVKAKPKPPPGHQLVDDGKIRTFRLEVAEPALSALQKDNRSYVRGVLKEGDKVYLDVGIHLKGMGSFRPLNEKPSFVVKFDRYTPDQHYRGL